MNLKIPRGMKIAIAALLLVFVIHQIYSYFYNPFTTQTVTSVKYYDGIDVVGYVIRDESVITSNASGVVSFSNPEGSKVAKDGVVANVFSSKEAADAYLEAENIRTRIQTLKDTQTYNDLYAADLDLLESKIFTSLVDLLSKRQGTDKQIGDGFDEELCNYLNRKQIITGSAKDFGLLISNLTGRLKACESVYGNNIGKITTDISGYFISVVDGYEQLLTTDDLYSVTAEKLDALEPAEVPANAICKVVSDYKWYIAASVGFDYSMTLSEGQKMTLKTSIKGYTDLPVSVECINRSENGEDAVVIFVCKLMSEELAGLRTIPVSIVKNSYTGLKVDNRAIRFNDEGVRGVYIYRNNQLKFVEVNLLYTGKYSIVEQQMGKENALRLYDEIVVKGRDLYDGKLVE